MKLERVASKTLLVTLIVMPLGFLGIFFLWPTLNLIYLGITGGISNSQNGAITISPLFEMLSKKRTWSVVANTLLMAIAGTIGSLILGVAGAWVLYGLRIPARRWWRGISAVPFVLPSVVVGVAFQNLLAPGGWLGFLGLSETRGAIVLGMVFFNFSLVTRIVGNAWIHLDERPVWAARALGASPSQAFLTVTLPRLAPAITASGSLVFLYCITSYGLVRVLGGVSITTLEVEIYLETATYLNLPGAAVLSILQIIIVVAALLFNNHARSRFEHSTKLNKIVPRKPRSEDAIALFLTSLGLILVALPLFSLLVSSLRLSGKWTFDNYLALFKTGLAPSLSGSVLQAAKYSLLVALIATVISLFIGMSVAVVVSRRARAGTKWYRAQELYDLMVSSPQGISGVTVGFGTLITLQAPPLSMEANAFFLASAQSVVAVPLVLRAVLPTLRAQDSRMLKIAATLGASPWRVFTTLELPVLLRVSGIGAGFAFAISLGEFGATSFLSRPLTPTLPIAIFALSSRPSVEAQGCAAAAAVLLAVICAVAMVTAEATSGKEN